MTFPALFTVGVHHCTESLDDYSQGRVFTPPENAAGTQTAVYGWSVPSSTEPHGEGRDNLVVTDVELLAPPDFQAGPNDLIDLPDGQYQVIGQPQDYNHGPFGWTPGKVVNLHKVTG